MNVDRTHFSHGKPETLYRSGDGTILLEKFPDGSLRMLWPAGDTNFGLEEFWNFGEGMSLLVAPAARNR